ncbi:DUF5691 domain-containing protein [Deinococcus roseus]|uniref:Uncharacterized protein n=1 Tax=Deinococcus roseus TaxID=392414 RepID=A0ABQ2DEX3_9DEIO|nr:DUF5691 domain-containing protein [Deinococcus roseus]GGJ55022.1 hypothetical protein GCM10008938_46360 [Deinococcus roseus]
MTATSAWETLKKQVLLGTARQPEAANLPEGLPVPQGTPEEQALFSLAALGLYLRVSREPQAAPAHTAEKAALEKLPECSPAATSVLQAVQATSSLLLPEILNLLQQRRWRVPHALLPSLLETATAETELRVPLNAVMGERGNWLARQNPRWKWAVQAQGTEQDWENGTPQERRQHLEKLRQLDPRQARTLLETGWKQEKAADRESFLQTFHSGLSGADEAFLEAALADRAKGVREEAGTLLARLPESAYQKRMQQRASTLIVKQPVQLSVMKKLQGQPDFKLEVQLPDTLPEDWKQDGIQEKSQIYGLGDKGYWLVQVVQKVDPDFWTALAGLEAKAFWQMVAQNKDWGKHLMSALTEAAKNTRNLQWLDVIQNYHNALWLEFYPADQHEQKIKNWLTQDRLPDVTVLRILPRWSADLSLHVLHVFSRKLKALKPNDYNKQYELERFLHQMALYLHPKTLQENLIAHPNYAQVEHLIDLRIRMHKEI